MIKPSSLRAALSLVALTAACGREFPGGPSAIRPSVVAGTTVADADVAASYAVIGDMPYGKSKLDSLPLTINPGRNSQLFTLTRVPLVPGQ